MQPKSTRPDPARQVSSQSISGVCVYLRAMACARFSPIETMLVMVVFELGWLRARFVLGTGKARSVELSPSKLAAFTGFDRSRIHDALKSLRIGNILMLDDDGRWRLNPRWQDWMYKDSTLRVKPECHTFVMTGYPTDHVCPSDDAPNGVPAEETTPKSGVPAQEPEPSNGVPAQESMPRSCVPGQEHSLSDAPIRNVSACACSRIAKPSLLEEDSSYAEPIEETIDRMLLGNDNSKDYFFNLCLATDNSKDAGAMHATADGTGESSQTHTHKDTTEDDFLDDLNAKFGSAYPGPHVPDEKYLGLARKLAELYFTLNDNILDGITRNRFRFPSAWIHKAVKRAWCTNRHLKNFGYIYKILKSWDAAGETDKGIEDDFGDLMEYKEPQRTQTPKIVNLPQGSQNPQPKLSAEERSQQFQELYHRLYPHG